MPSAAIPPPLWTGLTALCSPWHHYRDEHLLSSPVTLHFRKLARNAPVSPSPGLADFLAGYAYTVFFLKQEGQHQTDKVIKCKPSGLFYLVLEEILLWQSYIFDTVVIRKVEAICSPCIQQ